MASPDINQTACDTPVSSEARFPRTLALIHAGICVVASLVTAKDLSFLPLILVGLAVGLSIVVLVQWVVWKVLSRWVKNRRVWACFIFLPVSLLLGDSVWRAFPANRAGYTLRAGRLDSLPRSATEVKHYAWSGLFTGSQYVSFKAPKDDVETWIRNSPSLGEVAPKLYSVDKKRLVYPAEDSNWFDTKHDYFSSDKMAPSWWNGTLQDVGKTYEIPATRGGHNYGILIYDERNGIVYIRVTWS